VHRVHVDDLAVLTMFASPVDIDVTTRVLPSWLDACYHHNGASSTSADRLIAVAERFPNDLSNSQPRSRCRVARLVSSVGANVQDIVVVIPTRAATTPQLRQRLSAPRLSGPRPLCESGLRDRRGDVMAAAFPVMRQRSDWKE